MNVRHSQRHMCQPLAPAVFLNLLRYRRFRRKWLQQLNQFRPIAHAQQFFTHLIFSQNIFAVDFLGPHRLVGIHRSTTLSS